MSAPADEVRRVALTGASSGIGAAVARALGARGWSLALGARRMDRLEEVAKDAERSGGRVLARALDVTRPESIDAFFDAAESQLGAIDAVVSNAGVSFPGRLHELPVDSLRTELDTNLLGPMLVARRALPAMLERARGDLVFVTSLNAVLPRPLQVGYTAGKSGLEAVARTLQMELEGSGVRTTIVRPGPTHSEFGSRWAPDVIRRLLASWESWGVLRHHRYLPAERIADAVLTALTAPRGTRIDEIQVNPEAPVEGES